MKINLVTVFAAVLVAHTNANGAPSPSPTPFDITKVDTSMISADEIAKTIAHRNQLFQEEQQQNAQTDTEIKTQAQTLVDAAQASDQSAKALAAYQASVASIVTKANIAIAQLNGVVTKLHRAKWILCGVWVALCAFIALKLQGTPVIGAYSLYGVGALAAAGIAAIWIWV